MLDTCDRQTNKQQAGIMSIFSIDLLAMLHLWKSHIQMCHCILANNDRNLKETLYPVIFNKMTYTGELGYDGPLYDRFLHMTDNMLGPSPMHIKYSSYVYDGFCI